MASRFVKISLVLLSIAFASAGCKMEEQSTPPTGPFNGNSSRRGSLLSVTRSSDHGDTARHDIFSHETSAPPPPPRNLRVKAAGADSLSLVLSWDPPGQMVDGYIVYFMGDVLDTVDTNCYVDTPTALGSYSVRAYRKPNVSAAVGTTSALHEQTGQGPIYWMEDLDPSHPGGYGWDSTGTGTVYRVTSTNRHYIDFVLDASDDLRSPADTFGIGWHSTGIAYDSSWTYASLTVAPASGYLGEQAAVLNGVYALRIESGYYLKLQITTYDVLNHSIIFKFAFQRISGFRRLG